MRFQDLALHTLLRAELRALIREGKRRFACKGKDDLCLVTYSSVSASCIRHHHALTLTLVDILHDPLAVPNLRGRQRMNGVPQVRHRGLAHLLLMRDGRHREFARLLLDNREGRDPGFLCVGLAVSTVAIDD